MHGRIKVKTTAEQAEQKRKEREKKLKSFQLATTVAHKKIETKVFDDEGMAVVQQILNVNSDYSSMWHYRKRVFLSWKETKNEDEMNKTFKDELAFIASCLRNNPKSYGCWHHRCFVMLTMPNPDWVHELSLCDQFLQFDDRNFHCWDYRRFVVKNSDPKVSLDHEIECTNQLVENNFSNYSSWHYRSKLLPLRYPHSSTSDRIEESKLLEELELVQNAFFTDPNDQSAWFYHRWLLGRGNTSQGLIAVHACASPLILECVFRKPINEEEITAAVSVTVDDTIQEGTWKSLITDNSYQHAWVFKFSAGSSLSNKNSKSINVKYAEQSYPIILESERNESIQSYISHDEFRQELSSAKLELLQSELESCRQLNELEPGNKWAILTLVLLMRAIDPTKHRIETDKLVTELMSVDTTRKQYYGDLHSKFAIEDCISDREWEKDEVNISGRNLSRICHLQYFSAIKHLDLSKNRLKALSGPFHLLRNCKVILADGNEIEDFPGLRHMKKLTRLSLNQNCLRRVDAFKPLITCSNLIELEVTGNPVCDQKCSLEELVPNLTIKF